jgi:hypothetical protein
MSKAEVDLGTAMEVFPMKAEGAKAFAAVANPARATIVNFILDVWCSMMLKWRCEPYRIKKKDTKKRVDTRKRCLTNCSKKNLLPVSFFLAWLQRRQKVTEAMKRNFNIGGISLSKASKFGSGSTSNHRFQD